MERGCQKIDYPLVLSYLFVKLFFLEPRLLEIIRRLIAVSSMGLSPPAGSLSAALIA